MKRLICGVIVLLAAGWLMAGCGQGRETAPVTGATTPASRVSTPSAKTGWQEKWDSAVLEGKKEGKLLVYTNWNPELRIALSQEFRAKFGIEADFLPFSRGAEIPAKVQTEQGAGLYLADAFGSGSPTIIATMKPSRLLGAVEPLLILPEATDPKSWSGGSFPFVDKDKTVVSMAAMKQPFILYNTDLVKKGEITGYKDLLKPQYKGKIAITDPSLTGPSNSLLSHLAYNVWNVDETREFLRQLVKQQETAVMRDYRLHMESVSRGKYVIGIAPDTKNLATFMSAGAPVAVVSTGEGAYITASSGSIALPVKPAHPSAAKVFLNWLLTKEGQTVFARNLGSPSGRADVPPEDTSPIFVAQPGEKLFFESEEIILLQGKMRDIAKEVMDEAAK